MEYIKLNNGIEMPLIGFGTYFGTNMEEVNKTKESIEYALKNGYRLLDTAKWYNNEEIVGEAIRNSEIKREELFITSKIECKGFIETLKNVEDTLKKLNTEYLDLILIHWPEGTIENIIETYKALEELYKLKIAKSIGISNFNEELCEIILNNCKITPQVNQIETHIYFQEKKMNKYLNEKNICHQSWSTFGEGLINIFEDETIKNIAKKYEKSPSQIMLKFFIQKNISVLPRSTNKEHIKENINVFDFKLKKEDIEKIEKLDKKMQVSGWPGIMKTETKY